MKLFSSHGIHQRDIRRKSAAALLLSTCLLLPYLADIATAAKLNEICPNHPEHDAECGYTEYVVEQPCMHEHEGSCYTLHVHTDSCYAEIAADEVSDTLDEPPVTQANDTMNEMPETLNPDEESVEMPDTPFETLPAEDGFFDASGEEQRIPDTPAEIPDNIPQAPRKTLVCGLEEGAEVLCCPHEGGEHTEACGYAPAVEASPCMHTCPECAEDTEIELSADEDILEAGTEEGLLTALDANNTIKNIRLTADIDLSSTAAAIEISKQACLDLNGYTITFSVHAPTDQSVPVFKVVANGDFTIMDSVSANEEITENNVTDTTASYHDGILTYYVLQTRNNITNKFQHVATAAGLITSRDDSNADAIVTVDGGKFQLHGGMFANTTGVRDVYVNNGSFTMLGGYLTGINNSRLKGRGGAVSVMNASTATISGGVIAGNRSFYGGGIHITSSEPVQIGGTAVISGNTADYHGGGINTIVKNQLSITDSATICFNRAHQAETASEDNYDCRSIAFSTPAG